MMAFSLLESLAVTGLLVLLSVVLPGSWLRDGFGYKGFIILVIATADAILLQKSITTVFPSTLRLVAFSLAPILASVLLIMALRKQPRLQSLLVNIQDRFLIILFVYVPIGLISLMVVMFRNIL